MSNWIICTVDMLLFWTGSKWSEDEADAKVYSDTLYSFREISRLRKRLGETVDTGCLILENYRRGGGKHVFEDAKACAYRRDNNIGDDSLESFSMVDYYKNVQAKKQG